MINRRTLLQNLLSLSIIGLLPSNNIKIIGYGWCPVYKSVSIRNLPKTHSRLSFPGKFNIENRKYIDRLFKNPNSQLMRMLGWTRKIKDNLKEYQVLNKDGSYTHTFQYI